MEIATKEQMEMNVIVVERRVKTALSKNIPQYADHVFRIGDCALQYSENYGRWIGTFVANFVNGRMVTVKRFGGNQTVLLNSFQLKLYYDETDGRISSRQKNN